MAAGDRDDSGINEVSAALQKFERFDASWVAPKGGKKNGIGERAQRCFIASESARIGSCPAELRQGICAVWQHR
jgi:hypothetical protein